MLDLHLKALGHEAIGPLPDEVQQHLQPHGEGSQSNRQYRFAAHKGDIYVLGELGKKEKDMAAETSQTLVWKSFDDNTGGYLEARDDAERISYRTWNIPGGGKADQQVLVKNDGLRQTTLGYFRAKDGVSALDLAKSEAEGLTALGKAEKAAKDAGAALAKAQDLAKATGSGLAVLHAAMAGKGGGRSASASASTEKKEFSAGGNGGAITEGSASSASSATSTPGQSSSAESASDKGKKPWEKTETAPSLLAQSEGKCGKCGSSKDSCCCGNFGKSELCKGCGKASNMCKCMSARKSEAQAKEQELAKAEADRKAVEGRSALEKMATESNPPMLRFGKNAEGQTVGVDPDALRERLGSVYVAAKYILDQAAAAKK